jgi:cytochrome c oxidase cbb3-type subunit 1
MWVAGITQGLMWREYGADGYLVNAFAETVTALHPMYLLRAFGGLLYLAGAAIMTVNIWQTIAGRLRVEEPLYQPTYDAAADRPLTAASA